MRYDFSISDLQITTRQLTHFASASVSIQAAIAAVGRLAADCNYGARLRDEHDRRVLEVLLNDFCSPGVLRSDYRVQGQEAYAAPTGAINCQDLLKHL